MGLDEIMGYKNGRRDGKIISTMLVGEQKKEYTRKETEQNRGNDKLMI